MLLKNGILRLKAAVVASPLESTAKRFQRALEFPFRYRHPELSEIFLEEDRFPKVLSRLAKPSSNILDIGCHIGSFLSQAVRIAPHGTHAAIEASPQKAEWLQRKFPKVRIEQAAASDSCGTAFFEEHEDFPGFSRLSDKSSSIAPPGRVKSFSVRTVTLDSLGLWKFDIVKIDVEGAELSALQGGRQFFEHFKPALIFEASVNGDDRFLLYRHLTEHMRYDIFTFADFLYAKGSLSFDEFRKCGIYPYRAFNFVATPGAF